MVAVAAAVQVALGESAFVYDHVPETTAPPCAWLGFVAAFYDSTRGWEITFDVTVVADAGLGAVDAANQLATMTDAVLTMSCVGVEPRGMSARGGGLTTRVGDVAHPCTVVTVPQLNQVC